MANYDGPMESVVVDVGSLMMQLIQDGIDSRSAGHAIRLSEVLHLLTRASDMAVVANGYRCDGHDVGSERYQASAKSLIDQARAVLLLPPLDK